MKHRILFVLRCFPSLGGVEKVSLQLALAFREAGHDVAFVSCQSSAVVSGYWLESERFDTCALPDKDNIDAPENLAFLQNLIEEKDFDIILNQGVESSVYRLLAGNKKHHVINVLHCHPQWLFLRRRLMAFPEGFWKPSRWKVVLRWLYIRLFPAVSDKKVLAWLHDEISLSAAYVVLHSSYKDIIQTRLSALKTGQKKAFSEKASLEDMISVIPNSVWPSSLKTSGEKIVLFSGRLSKADKRIDRLLRIWAKAQDRLPDWRLHIVGEGPEKTNLEKMTRRLALSRVEFLPPVYDESLYAKASVCALTSTLEGQSLSLMEAQLAGMVPVVFNVNKMMEDLLQNGTCGFLVPPFDEEAFANALVKVCQDDALRAEMSERACGSMEAYATAEILPKWLSLFDEMGHGSDL